MYSNATRVSVLQPRRPLTLKSPMCNYFLQGNTFELFSFSLNLANTVYECIKERNKIILDLVNQGNSEIQKAIRQFHKTAASRIDRASRKSMEVVNEGRPRQIDRFLKPGDLIYEKECAQATKLEQRWKSLFLMLKVQTPNLAIWVNGKKKIIYEANAKLHM